MIAAILLAILSMLFLAAGIVFELEEEERRRENG